MRDGDAVADGDAGPSLARGPCFLVLTAEVIMYMIMNHDTCWTSCHL